MLGNFFHRLFNPHCPDCKLQQDEERTCKNCDTLRQLLEVEKFENKQLLDRILYIPKERNEPPSELPRPVQIGQHTSLRIRREMMEREDRVAAQKLRDKEHEMQSTESLEQELLLEVK